MTPHRRHGEIDLALVTSMMEELTDSGAPTLDGMARRLGTSPRTLQRILSRSDQTFSCVLHGLRRDLAKSLLRNSTLSIQEIAAILGYARPSGFARAFRKWTGHSPRAFRRRLARTR